MDWEGGRAEGRPRGGRRGSEWWVRGVACAAQARVVRSAISACVIIFIARSGPDVVVCYAGVVGDAFVTLIRNCRLECPASCCFWNRPSGRRFLRGFLCVGRRRVAQVLKSAVLGGDACRFVYMEDSAQPRCRKYYPLRSSGASVRCAGRAGRPSGIPGTPGDSQENPRRFPGAPRESQDNPRRIAGEPKENPSRLPGQSQEISSTIPGEPQENPRMFPGESQEIPRRIPGES